MNQIYREKSSQSRAINSLALRDEKNRRFVSYGLLEAKK